MGAIVGVSILPKRVIMFPGRNFRNATGFSEGTSAANLGSAQAAVDAAQEALKAEQRLLTARQEELDNFIVSHQDTLKLYNETYPLYKQWYDKGGVGDTTIQNLIQKIVVGEQWQKGTWGNAKVENSFPVKKKENSYDRVYLPPNHKNIYFFQVGVVRNFITDIVAKYNNYQKELKEKQALVNEQSVKVNQALARYNEAQKIKNQTAIAIANAENMPEVERIKADASVKLSEIKADSEYDKQLADAELKSRLASNRTVMFMVLGGIGLLAAISVAVVLKK